MEKSQKKKILIAGLTQSNFIKQLYSAIDKTRPGYFDFDIVDLKELSGKNEYDGFQLFRHEYKSANFKKFISIKYLFSKAWFSQLFFLLGHGIIRPKLILAFAKHFAISANLYNTLKKNNYDIFHFHFPRGNRLFLFWQLRKEDKCVISFWGSDLLRTTDFVNYCLQKKALQRADIITTHSVEMREIILAKFGRNLFNKIQFTKFPPNDDLYNLIDENRLYSENHKSEFGFKRGFDPNKKWVVIGHNGSRDNNHIPIINSLGKLSPSTKEKIFLIFPFTYKQTSDGIYEESIINSLNQNCISGGILSDFLTWEELAKLKCLTDVMIHLPVSDALSGALTESIYAGSKVITGSWLPYSPLSKAGIVVSKIDSIDELPLVFNDDFIDSYSEEESIKNRDAIKSQFLSHPCALTWLKVLE